MVHTPCLEFTRSSGNAQNPAAVPSHDNLPAHSVLGILEGACPVGWFHDVVEQIPSLVLLSAGLFALVGPAPPAVTSTPLASSGDVSPGVPQEAEFDACTIIDEQVERVADTGYCDQEETLVCQTPFAAIVIVAMPVSRSRILKRVF